ncbi:beta-amylase, putative [Ricinus communis]|uniref:Beta-amylase n=1 Tax=Ricinus communis TaxID=3988 RepID=B9S9S9_RICCO|nr:beta-amylase, putative [Ricinus communis]
MDAREKSRSTVLESSKHKRVPIFVMMPADIFAIDSSGTPRIRKIKALKISLKALKLAGVYGIAVETCVKVLGLWVFLYGFERMEDLKMAACQEGKPQWGDRGPQNAGCYNSLLPGIPFFEDGKESFLSDYGRFFLEWYSGKLICHADAILAKASNLLKKYQENKQTPVILVAKIGGIYWWYQTVSHPAELTAGYYNTALRDGYDAVASVLSRHGAALHISCLEMMDSETPPAFCCSPEGLLQQIRTISKKRIHFIGRNTSERFDQVLGLIGAVDVARD